MRASFVAKRFFRRLQQTPTSSKRHYRFKIGTKRKNPSSTAAKKTHGLMGTLNLVGILMLLRAKGAGLLSALLQLKTDYWVQCRTAL